MSRLEYFLWAGDFMIGGIGWLLGGPYAGLLCFAVAGMLIFLGLRKREDSKSGILIDEHTPYIRSRIKSWHKWGLGVSILCIAALIIYGAIHHILAAPPNAGLQPPSLAPVSFRLGCEPDHIPIHIPAASTIHVIRVHPSVLLGNANIPDVGVFADISSGATTALDWPSKSEGRWMTVGEQKKFIEDQHSLPFPFTAKCELSSYGAVTLDEIGLTMLVDTTDGKRHSYPVAFDPLMSGHPFPFYVVSVCSSGVIPRVIQWDDFANVRVLGEQKTRRVPLRYEKRNWPSQLLGFWGSNFVWNGLDNCQWNKEQ